MTKAAPADWKRTRGAQNAASSNQYYRVNPTIDIAVTNAADAAGVDTQRLTKAVACVLRSESVTDAQVSVALVDDTTIHELNRRYLDHDYPTDVLSFPMSRGADRLEGEIVVSLTTAARQAADYGWAAADELLLYVVHGALHLLGYDDHRPEDLRVMRQREIQILAQFGVTPNYPSPAAGEITTVQDVEG